ncbi:VRR-NUC domain-containing protein [Candidatus Woesearchaeota archaeon]|nr:VRR-NUC domain-containing protein [Candidatus Woesearchaeota archaeon]
MNGLTSKPTFIEVKANGSELTEHQKKVMAELKSIGYDVSVRRFLQWARFVKNQLSEPQRF